MAPQIHRSPAYLSHNKYGYCFRLKVPDDLQCYLEKKELRYSLKTGYLRVSKNRARFIVGNIQMLFSSLRRGDSPSKQLTPELVNDLIRQYRDMAIEDAMRPANRNQNDPTKWDYGIREVETEEELYRFMDGHCSLAEFYKFKAVTGDYEGVDVVADKLCNKSDIAYRSDSDEFRNLCRGMLFADREAIGITLDILKSGYPTVLRKHGHQIRDKKPEEAVATARAEKPSVTLGAILDEFWKRREGGWGAGALESYARYKKRLLVHFGAGKPIDAISYKEMEQFRDELKATGNRGKPIAIKTVNLHLDFYTAIFNHAIQSGRITHNPVNVVKLADKRNKQGLNDPWENEDLKKLFHSAEYKEDLFEVGWQFWLPPLLLYTGARLEELCQLYLDEIKVVDGVWVFDIDQTRPDQTVKTYEKRYIPLHPFITDELNFVAYARSLPDQSGRLFPELKPIGLRQRYGHYPSSHWFPKFKKRCGVVSPPRKKTFHSIRHTVGSRLMEQDVQDYVNAMLMGHEHPQISTGLYGKKYEPRMLLEKAVLKLDYGIDLSHLKESRYVIK